MKYENELFELLNVYINNYYLCMLVVVSKQTDRKTSTNNRKTNIYAELGNSRVAG